MKTKRTCSSSSPPQSTSPFFAFTQTEHRKSNHGLHYPFHKLNRPSRRNGHHPFDGRWWQFRVLMSMVNDWPWVSPLLASSRLELLCRRQYDSSRRPSPRSSRLPPPCRSSCKAKRRQHQDPRLGVLLLSKVIASVIVHRQRLRRGWHDL